MNVLFRNYFIITLLILFFSKVNYAQDTTDLKKIGFEKLKKEVTKEQINQLKQGALLVRLQTKNNSVAALRKTGKNKMADKVEDKQRELNLRIVDAFKHNFNFCPVYFFYSDYSQDVINQQLHKVVFLDNALEEDSSIKFNHTSFLTAEFGTVEEDTAKYFSNYKYSSDESGSLERNRQFYGSPKLGFAALVIKNSQFIQLRRPFPYYARSYRTLPFEREPSIVVREMNRRLKNFYRKVNNW